MAIVITVLYNREDASEVVGVQTRDVGDVKDVIKSAQAVKQAVDFARSLDPITLLQNPAQKGVFIRDVEKSTMLTDAEKQDIINLLVNSGPLDVATFGIGDRQPPLIAPPANDAPPQMPPVIVEFLDP